MNRDDFERLQEIQSEMLELINEAANIVKRADKQEYQRAKAYWIGQVKQSLGDSNYITHSPTMESTINSLNPTDVCADCEVELTSDNSDEESDYCWDCEEDDEEKTGNLLETSEHNNP